LQSSLARERIGGTRKMRPLRNGWAELTMLTREFFTRPAQQ